jgi:hypothetical protein
MGVAMLLPATTASAATTTINLRTATNFAVLAGTGITNSGATTITGDIGSFPTTAIDSDEITLHGVIASDTVTNQAKTDLTAAYNQAAGSGPPAEVGTELASPTPLTPGVYHSDTLGITGTLTLNTLGDPFAVFIFQAESGLTTASASNVQVLGGGLACNVFWKVGSSAALGDTSHIIGSVLASTSITVGTGATIDGRLLAGTGDVTLLGNTITKPDCSTVPTTTPTSGGPATTVAAAATTRPGTTAPRPAGSPELPRTGSNLLLPVIGVLCVGVGTALVRASSTRAKRS